MDWGEREDRYVEPGTKVRLDNHWDGADVPTPEYGIVVHCWKDGELGMYDCYIAFFGDDFPEGKPDEKPYILRYAAASLRPAA
ncbi:hypothetical protein [Sphingobium subterraneum]|uniref:Uncharacterized protein n=1 Tax=Sphingobium subterraneum TaxID=627688 RepID=A0A841IZN0_9SPHN|nr:hypothetical protein [Sphingobium subterraneum]MBB6122726.1 hypothetical protein [Sphingobium subterraneum]